MVDIWTRQTADDKTVMFKIEGDKATGFVYSAKMEGRDIVQVTGSLEGLTRGEVEARFADYLAGK